MFRSGLGIFLAVAMSVSTVFAAKPAIKGVAVSVAWRSGAVPDNQTGTCFYPRGNIVKFTINGSSIVCDTIYRDTAGFAQYPSMSLDGKRVAFYRHGEKLVSATNSRTGDVTKSHISVINIDGTGLRDLCAIARPNNEAALDWPASDWIYYVKPKFVDKIGWDACWYSVGLEVWRVNVSTLVNEKVCHFANSLVDGSNAEIGWIRRFTMNLAGTVAALQFINFPTNRCTNCAYRFPPPNCDAQAATITGTGSCNIAVSTSGSYVAGYSDAAHQRVELAKLYDTITGPTPISPTLANAQAWSNHKMINGVEFSGNGELIRWSVNSDKWLCLQAGWNGHADRIANGSNQELINWVDSQAVIPSNNPQITPDWNVSQIYYGNCPGDFWVDAGQALNQYQDASGVWHTIAGYIPYNGTQANNFSQVKAVDKLTCLGTSIDPAGNLRIKISPNAQALVRLMDMQGKTLFSAPARHTLSVPAHALPVGMCLVGISVAGKESFSKITISR